MENHREFGRQNVEAMIEARSSKMIIAFFISSFSLYFKNFGIESMKQWKETSLSLLTAGLRWPTDFRE